MRKTLSMLTATAIAVTSLMAPAAHAAPLTSLPTAQAQSAVQDVQYRRYHRGDRYYGNRYYHRQHRGNGAAVAAGVVGLAAGVLAAQALSQPRYAPAPVYRGGGDWYAYCASKYRSFDPASGTYLGYDGRRHYCR